MGIRQYELDMLDKIIKDNNLTYKGLKMLQLGDQVIRTKKSNAKAYFEKLGCNIVSIDINGLGGSLPLDLSKPIDRPDFKNAFDIITNFGTSEHVSDDAACYDNMNDFCKIGGILYNLVPRKGSWKRGTHKHAHKYETEYFDNLAKKYGYEIILNRVISGKERYGLDKVVDEMIIAIFRKV